MRNQVFAFLTLILLIFDSQYLVGQNVIQLPIFTQFRENQSILNPAALNTDFIRNDYNFSAGVSLRNQWGAAKLRLPNNKRKHFGPETQTARVEWIFPESRLMVGTHFINDQAGGITQQGAYLRAGYLVLDPNVAAIGLVGALGIGYNNFRSDLIKEGVYDYNVQYSTIQPTEDQNANFLDYTLGVFLWGKVLSGTFEGDIIYGGISIPQAFGIPYNNEKKVTETSEDFDPDVNIVLGMYKYWAEETFLEVAINYYRNLSGVLSARSITLNSRIHYRDVGWLGVGGRFPVNEYESPLISNKGGFNTLLFEAGINIGKNVSYAWESKNLKIGMGYEIPILSELKPFGNTIELNVTFTLDTQGGRL